jgi:beta-mannosidase
MHPYQDYKKFTARFISEFGFESPPDIRTINKAITDPRERHSQSRTFDAHDKGPGNVRRYGMYMAENYRFKMSPLADYIYCAQFLQAEAMRYAYNLWRREFRGPGEEYCAGVLVWQLNDIWPGTSWALVDVDLHRKPSFFITKRALAPMMIGIERAVTKLPPSIVSSYLPEKHKAEVWAVSGVTQPVETVISFAAWDIETGKSVPLQKDEIKVTLAPNRTTELTEFDIPAAEDTALVAYLKDANSGEVLARWVSWPEPLKYLRFKKDLRVDIKVLENGNAVILTANAPAKGVVLAVPEEDGDDAIWDDNFIDMVPGEEVRVKVEGLNGRKVKARFLCDWEVEA